MSRFVAGIICLDSAMAAQALWAQTPAFSIKSALMSMVATALLIAGVLLLKGDPNA